MSDAARPAGPIPIESHWPHVTGNAQCRCCAHGWVAVVAAVANLWLLECPRCRKLYGHMVGAFPDSPYQAKVWSEEMWRYWYRGELPDVNVAAQSESPSETDGDAGSVEGALTGGVDILTVKPSRWITSSLSSSAEQTGSTTCGQPTANATVEEGGQGYVETWGYVDDWEGDK